jgi:hypothetical protein
MDFYIGQILLVSLMLAVIQAVTLGFLLDIRRARITKTLIFPILSREEILALAMAWILVGIFCWNVLVQEELHVSYAVAAVAMITFLIISKVRRERLKIIAGMRWYVWLVTTMILATFLGVIIRSEFLIIIGSIALAIIMIYETWSRILGLPK